MVLSPSEMHFLIARWAKSMVNQDKSELCPHADSDLCTGLDVSQTTIVLDSSKVQASSGKNGSICLFGTPGSGMDTLCSKKDESCCAKFAASVRLFAMGIILSLAFCSS